MFDVQDVSDSPFPFFCGFLNVLTLLDRAIKVRLLPIK